MRLKVIYKNINLWLLLLLLCMCEDVLPKNPYKGGEVRADLPKGCAYLRCNRGDQCVNRKFWCRNPPCPSMLYCSKSRKESLKGPSSCEAVRCSKGFICLVRVRHCRWGEPCEQQIARCVSERDYYDGPASCADFKCPTGLRCILRESLCAKPPCKLMKSCANTKDVKMWYDGCKSLGCLSEHECFLRRPTRDCRISPCKHTPDCSAKSEEELEAIEQCRGWVCPKGEECSTHTQGPCKRDSCRISRSCHRPLMVPLNVALEPKHSWKDDVKLSFYSKLDKNLSTSETNSPYDISTSGKNPQDGVAEDKKISTNSEIGKFHENPIYKAPISVSPNPRPGSSRPQSASPDIISGRDVQPTVTSLSTWLNHLKLKTGVDAIEAWMEKAEKQENYGAFLEWLESVKDLLGSAAYDLWIEEVRTMTVTSPAFQKWLPPIPSSSPSVSPDFVEPVTNIAVVNHRELGISPGSQKSITYPSNQHKNYSWQGWMNDEVQKPDVRKNDDSKEENYIFPPKNDTLPVQPEILGKDPIVTLSGFSTSPPPANPLPINEWQPFYNKDSKLVQQANPFQQNIGKFVPWSNQATPFPRLDAVNPMNPWYQQFQQTPGVDSHFPNDQTWQGPLSPLMNTQRNQLSMDRRFLDLAKIPDQHRPSPWGSDFVLPARPEHDQMSINRFLGPGNGIGQQFQTDWASQQRPDTNSQFLRSNTWQGQFGPSLNPHQQQDPIDENFLAPEKFPEQQFQANWSFQQTPNNDPNFLSPNVWQEKLFPPVYPDWRQDRDSRYQFNRRILESAKLPSGFPRQMNEGPSQAYSDNSTNENTSWVKFFHEQASRQKASPENLGTFPITGENLSDESWPGSNYQGRSPADVPHRRTKHEDLTRDAGQFRYSDRDARRPGETLQKLDEYIGFLPRFSWLMDPRLRSYYLHLLNQDRRNLYEKYNRESPSALVPPSRTHRFDAGARSPLPNPFFEDSERDLPRLNHHWPNADLYDRLYGMAEPWPSSIAQQRPAIENQEYDERLDPSPKLNKPVVSGDRTLGSVFRDREFDAPGQSMELPDLWNPKFRNPFSSVLHKLDRERWDYRDEVEKIRPITTTTSPTVVPSSKSVVTSSKPIVPSSKPVVPQQIIPIEREGSHDVEDDDYQEGIYDIDDYYDDDIIFPLLLSLQGYIETSNEEEPEKPSIPSKNSIILPVYRVEDVIDEVEDYNNDYANYRDSTANLPSSSDDESINLFENVFYGGTTDFPNNLKNDLEAAMNPTGESDGEIKDVKWEYEDEEGDTYVDDPSSYFVPSEDSLTSTNGLSSIDDDRDWATSMSGARNDADTENDYYDEGVDYEERTVPGDRSNYNFEPVNTGDSLIREQVPEHRIDSFYDDRNHKRIKKNRP